MKNFEFSKKVSQTEAQGTCVLQLIALMDVSTVRLSILTTMDNGRQQRPSNSPILLFAHLWSNASQLIMNPNQIRPLSNICQLDVSAAFSTEASTLYHIMWREEPFSHFICLINPPFFFPPATVRILTLVRVENQEGSYQITVNVTEEKEPHFSRLLMLQNPNNVRNCEECNSLRCSSLSNLS